VLYPKVHFRSPFAHRKHSVIKRHTLDHPAFMPQLKRFLDDGYEICMERQDVKRPFVVQGGERVNLALEQNAGAVTNNEREKILSGIDGALLIYVEFVGHTIRG
jgi:hypothetical protein